MADEARDDIGLHVLDYWRVIRSRKEIVLAVSILVVLTGAAITFTLPRIYMSEARIQVRPDTLDVNVFERELVPAYDPYFLRTQYQVIQSRSILYEVIKNLDLTRVWGKKYRDDGQPLTLQEAYEILSGKVQVEQFRDTSLISIKVYHDDPEEAARIANEIAYVYRDYRLSLKRNEIKRAIDALKNELEKQRDVVNRAEEEVEKLRKELGVSTIIGGVRLDKLRLQQLEADRIAARVDMLVRKSRLEQLENLTGENLMNASAYIVQDPAIAAIRQNLIDTEVSLKLARANYGENHPQVQRLLAGRAELHRQLDAALEGLKKGLRADYEVAKQKYEALDAELRAAKEMDIEAERERFLPFERAQRNLDVQRSILDALRARVAQEGIEFHVPRTPVEVVDEAEPGRFPVKPNVYLNLIISLVLGLGAGVGLAYFIEYLDTSVKTVEDVERYLGLPVLGIIPQKVRPLNEEGPDSPHAEAYRVLRTNLQFAVRGTGGGAYAFLSGGVGEGKSTTLFNLAYVCAQLGDRVLIVESDLRRPVLHKMLGTSNRFGLTNVLLRDVPVEETIKPTEVNNLHFLPSGRLPRTSLGLLDSQKMRELIKNLKMRYDLVFFDAPPVMGVSDASILASQVDGALLVVQYRKYPRIMTLRAKKIIENVGGRIIGVVLNNINIMRDDYYYYYHSYGHYELENISEKEAADVES